MPKAKKLPSGSWRTRVYSHSIPVLDPAGQPVYGKDGKPKEKKIYESFTAETKKESELMAAEFAAGLKSKENIPDMTLREAITRYIESSDAVLSKTTIAGYKKIQAIAFSDIMDMPIRKLTNAILAESVNTEAKRPNGKYKRGTKSISPKTVCNEYGLITAVLNRYRPKLNCTVTLPQKEVIFKEVLPPNIIMDVVRGTDIELASLLAMWLSFSMSEIRGLTKSKSIDGDYITIKEVVVNAENKIVRKSQGKVTTRNRRHRIPPYIKQLINQVNGDALVPLNSRQIYYRFTKLLKDAGLPHMSFHDLRHVNASVMALLHVPDKYAMERGGWKTDSTMKKVYTHTFSPERQKVDDLIDGYFENAMQRSRNNI